MPAPKKSTARPTFAEIGDAAKRAAQRAALLDELKAQDWNLSAVARSLGMGDASTVIRAIRKLGLDDEYNAARGRRDVRPGPRQAPETQAEMPVDGEGISVQTGATATATAVGNGSTLVEISRAAQRAALLVELARHRWNLTATAKSLGLAGASNVVRSLRSLGLEPEYEAAKARGDVRAGRGDIRREPE